MAMLWTVGGEGNPIKGSQPPLLCDVSLENALPAIGDSVDLGDQLTVNSRS